MPSADSSLLNPGLCANTGRSFETGDSPCSEPARRACAGCYLVQVRYIYATCEKFQLAIANLFGISTAVRSVSWFIGRGTRRAASPHISRKHGGRRGTRKAASLHSSMMKRVVWWRLPMEACSIRGVICRPWMCLISNRTKGLVKPETIRYSLLVRLLLHGKLCS